MTDISREAVERMATLFETPDHFKPEDYIVESEVAKTLRALRDALDKAEAEKCELALQVIASEGQAQDAYAAQKRAGVERDNALTQVRALSGVVSAYEGFSDHSGGHSFTCTHPNKQASTCGFESCPDCGARLEEE